MSAARPFLVKVCGVTAPADAELAVAAGADAIGVNLWPASKRFVDDGTARDVLAAIPEGILKVGVFVNEAPADVAARVATLGLDRAQVHGDEKAAAFEGLDNCVLIRAVRVRDEKTFSLEAAWEPGLWLYDAFAAGYGGSGLQAPWPLIARLGRRPFLLAGGLTPDNVAAGIAAVRPDGVDVASGVESAPGRKDATRLRRFIEAARAASRER
ncbi:MAG TPA: phosphoribosylanthranilate isomerase [Polyangia bacterium]|nr:phosphoribosylanthranilate isomerase [Polyangia bacterium]